MTKGGLEECKNVLIDEYRRGKKAEKVCSESQMFKQS